MKLYDIRSRHLGSISELVGYVAVVKTVVFDLFEPQEQTSYLIDYILSNSENI